MISRPLTRVVNSTEMFLVPGTVLQAEGQALVRLPGGMQKGVTPSTGVAGEMFQGFVFVGTSAYPFPEMTTSKVETIVAGLGGRIVLAETPIAPAQVLFFDTVQNTVVTGTVDPTNPNAFTGFTQGNAIRATYKYNMSVVQAVALRGDVQPGGYSGAYVNQVGVVTRGLIFTDQFDTSKDYSTLGRFVAGTSGPVNALVVAAGGQVTVGPSDGSAGAVIPGTAVRLPDDMYPFLGIEFSANV